MSTGPDYPEPPSHTSLDPYQGQDGRNALRYAPPSFGMGPDTSNQSPDRNDALNEVPNDAKRPRACEPCRQLKVRCDPDPKHPDGSCKRCAKARRACIVTAPTRKRQKKTDSRVAELERKIDALTATLQASHSTSALFAGGAVGQQQSPPKQQDDYPPERKWMGGESKLAGIKRRRSDHGKDSSDVLLAPRYSRPSSPSAEQIPNHASRHWRRPIASASLPPPPKPEAANEFADMIDRGIIDYDTASAAFDRFIHQMAPELPFIVFPPGTTMGDVRRNKPSLFLAIIAAGLGVFNHDAQHVLVNEVYRLIADQAIIKGQKSLELVQTILVTSIWYYPPDNFEELKFYSLTHMAVAMAMELGLNHRSVETRRGYNMIRELISKKPMSAVFDPDGPEARRTWMGCYYLAVQTSVALRRVHLVTWQPYMDECLEILENHPDALPTDRKLRWWVKLALIMEDAGPQLSVDDPGSIATFADSRAWYYMRKFEERLTQWREEVPPDVYTESMAHTEHVLNIFVHESAMSVGQNIGTNSPSQDDNPPSPSTAAVIAALTTAIHCIHQSIDLICAVDIDRLICLPTMSVARTTYPVVTLIKIYSLLAPADSGIGHMLDVQSLKLDYYLDKVIAHYRIAASRDGGRVCAKFGSIIVLLRNWFIKKRDQGDHGRELKEAFSNGQTSPLGSTTRTTQMVPGMTPLHFLSEVAMGDPAHRANNANSQHSMPGQSYSSNPSPSSTVNPMKPPGTSSFGPDPSQASWSSGRSYPTPISGSDSNQIETRGYYQPYTSADTSQAYPDLSSTTGQSQGYPDIPTVGGMQLAPPMGIAPELGMDPIFGDTWFSLESMMDEGLVTLPLSFDGNFGLF
ncbi:hypothetical protein N7457_003832 [Penicillium paradoxum]|uniref:uncharacterized protein n=1 Tax=Penicillium paradoxum TaxID=176176 RepID=UPI002549267E|nr:uncharacterized protein N7457_003832 [Penicillium paradoxum]KAJ5782058.1 hypothetical protein N7457_003832 [Penicillium paradoxum]